MPKPRRKTGGVTNDAAAVAHDMGGVATDAAPQNVGDTTAGNIDRARVALRAYELYLARGGTDGRDMDDWLAAERELQEGERRGTPGSES